MRCVQTLVVSRNALTKLGFSWGGYPCTLSRSPDGWCQCFVSLAEVPFAPIP